MSSVKPQLELATKEEYMEELLNLPNNKITIRKKLQEGLSMTINKINSPSISVSPAVIGLIFTLIVQTCMGVWWAASISAESTSNRLKIEKLQSELDTQKVYIDTAREKLIRIQADVEAMQNKNQLEQLLKEQQKERGR